MSKREKPTVIRHPWKIGSSLLEEGTSDTHGNTTISANIMAAEIVAAMIGPTFGPRGMKKLITNKFKETKIADRAYTILEELDLRDTLIFWEGRYFLASTWFDEEEKVGVQFRSRDHGIALTFHHDDWQAIKTLFRRGWQAPEVRRLWDALAREYGEL